MIDTKRLDLMNEKPIKVVATEEIKKKIGIDLVDRVYSQAVVGYIASGFCAIIVSIVLYYSKEPQYFILHTWLTIFFLLIVLRAILGKLYKLKNDLLPAKKWGTLFAIGATLSGASWGIVGTPFILPENDPISASIILIIMSGVAAGGVPILSPIKAAALGFITATLLPLIIYFVLLNEFNYWLLDFTLSVFLAYLLVISIKTHKLIYNSLQLKYENEELMNGLVDAQNKLMQANKQLELAATHDPLTNIANRTLFEQKLKHQLKESQININKFSLLYLDVDKFKEVNDTYGHSTGDKLLLILIARIKKILRKNDTVARLGGDEFAIILDKTNDISTASDVATRICASVAQPVNIEPNIAQVYASIGISVYPDNGKDMDSLIKAADNSMYVVKKKGGNNFDFSKSNKEKI